jgi:hypothetical protein
VRRRLWEWRCGDAAVAPSQPWAVGGAGGTGCQRMAQTEGPENIEGDGG